MSENPKDVTIGNQHATPTELAWLAGFMDGEGSIQMNRYQRRSNSVGFTPRVSYANTDPSMINHADTIIRKLGIIPRIYEQDRADWKKVTMHVQIGKISHVRTLLEALMPHLVGKKARAELMLKYITRRMERGFDQDDCDTVFVELKQLNHRGAVRDCTQEQLPHAA